VDRLASAGWEVAVLDHRDRRYDPLPAGVRSHQAFLGSPDGASALDAALPAAQVVFHLSWTSIHEGSNRDPLSDLLANVVPSLELINACIRAGVQKLVFVSSGGTVYGPALTLPIPESHPTRPRSAYGIHKLAVEQHLELARRQHGLDYAVLRPSVAYGPRQDPLRRQGAVAVFLDRIASGAPVTIYGSDQISRDYLYVHDLVDALLAAARCKTSTEKVAGPVGPGGQDDPDADALGTGDPGADDAGAADPRAVAPGADAPVFNVGGPTEVTLGDLIRVIEQTVGRTAHIEYAPARPFDAPRIVLDTSRARRELRWAPQTAIEDGVGTTWAWMRSNQAAPGS
jgi:UDP-glucose 4-epimerase